MSHRVNVILEDEDWAAPARLRQGERSPFVNRAIATELLRGPRTRVMDTPQVQEYLHH